jgi:hypothetical protein
MFVPNYNWQRCWTCGGNGVSGGYTCPTCRGVGGWYPITPPPYYPPYRPPYKPWNRTPQWVPKCTCGTTTVCPVHPEGPLPRNTNIS